MRQYVRGGAACLALAVASLALLPDALSYDAWSWLVWGREIASLDLDTGAGPSWKPLPALVAAVLSPAGDELPELWLVVVRTAWLASIALAYAVASDLAGRTAGHGRAPRRIAGGIAAGAMVLMRDPQIPWLRHFANGLSEPLLVAFVLAAIQRHLAGSPRQALALATLAALVRPEVWPFLGLYGVWLWRSGPGARRSVGLALAAVPVLWIGGDLLGSGAAFTGSERARVFGVVDGFDRAIARTGEVLELVLELPLPAAWPLAAIGVWLGPRSVARPLALAAGAWTAIVVVEHLLGYYPLARFALPAAAVVCVLAGVGAVGLWTWARRHGRRVATVAVAVLVLAAVPSLVLRAGDLDGDVDGALARGDQQAELLRAVEAAGGPEAPARCGRAAVDDFLLAPALAWELRLPLSRVDAAGPRRRLRGGLVVVARGGETEARLLRERQARRLGGSGRYAVFSLPCLEEHPERGRALGRQHEPAGP